MSSADASPELAQIEAVIAAIDRDTRQAEGERTERRQQRAVEARAGRLGPEWQEVQQRIDAGETSVEDVFTGRDHTPAARRLVETSQRNLTELGELAQQDDAIREQLAEVEQELVQWDGLGDPDAPTAVEAPVVDEAAAPVVDGVRSATDTTTGAVAPRSEAGTAPPSPATGSGRSPDVVPTAGLPVRDPVADRVDATGLRPAEPAPHDDPDADHADDAAADDDAADDEE